MSHHVFPLPDDVYEIIWCVFLLHVACLVHWPICLESVLYRPTAHHMPGIYIYQFRISYRYRLLSYELLIFFTTFLLAATVTAPAPCHVNHHGGSKNGPLFKIRHPNLGYVFTLSLLGRYNEHLYML